MAYPGGKSSSGVYQKIINQMPPHDVYIEPFLGGGSVMKYKRPALSSIGIDADVQVVENWRDANITGLKVINADALAFLPEWFAATKIAPSRVLVYMDPPYLGSARASSRPIYTHEMLTEEEHIELLEMAKGLPCSVILSGYYSDLYETNLQGWRHIEFQTMTRGGFPAMESLWMNYPEPYELHDYRYLGDGYRERERIKRKVNRWRKRLEEMGSLERYALLEAMNTVRGGDASVSL